MYLLWAMHHLQLPHLLPENLISSKVQNIIIETKVDSKNSDLDAAISDKDNKYASPDPNKKKKQEYNHANPKISRDYGKGGEETGLRQKELKGNGKSLEKEFPSSFEARPTKSKQQIASYGGGDIAPTVYKSGERPVINLYNRGRPAFASKSKEYAQYFLNMQKKIEKYHREFFPIYQYYQGLLKGGEVVVEYGITQEGEVVDYKILKSYGSDIVDKSSLNSIKYAKNFGALPTEFAGEEVVMIRFHFIYMES